MGLLAKVGETFGVSCPGAFVQGGFTGGVEKLESWRALDVLCGSPGEQMEQINAAAFEKDFTLWPWQLQRRWVAKDVGKGG